MLNPSFTYEEIIENSIKVAWHIDDLFPNTAKVELDRPHLPDALTRSRALDWLSPREQLTHNHLRGHAYANLFGFVEEYIIGQTVRHAEAEVYGDAQALRALLRFSEEEVKHQMLFHRYCAAFARDYGKPCDVLDSAAEVANIILSNSPMAVMLVTLHLELITQQHYTEAIRDSDGLDPVLARILKSHWVEESQHARIDILELAKMQRHSSPDLVEVAFDEYFAILDAFDGLLADQTAMDLTSLQAFMGDEMTESERERAQRIQHLSYREDFLVMGMTNRRFVEITARLQPDSASRLEERVRVLREAA